MSCFSPALSKSATAKVRRKSALRERLQETPEPHSRNPIISPGLIENLQIKHIRILHRRYLEGLICGICFIIIQIGSNLSQSYSHISPLLEVISAQALKKG